MIILHAVYLAKGLLFWAETSDKASATPAKTRKAKAASKVAEAQPHPFALKAADLLGILGEFCGAGRPHPTQGRGLLCLPTSAGVPIASSPILGFEPEDGLPEDPPRDASTSQPWAVPGALVAVADSVDLLLAFGRDGDALIRPGLVAGADIMFWARMLRFAAATAASGMAVPDIGPEGPPRWTPIMTGSRARSFADMVQSMPAACRCASLSPGTSTAPGYVSYAVFASLVDSFFKSGLASPPSASPTPPSTMHDAWLEGVVSQDTVGTDWRLVTEALSADMAKWHRPLGLSFAAPYRLVFRLDDPADADGNPTWNVSYHIHPIDDPSLMVPVEDVLDKKARLRSSGVLDRPGISPKEFVLASLASAAAVSPDIALSLRQARPRGYELDTAGAHAFLSGIAPYLEALGYGVMLPAWWASKGTRMRLTAAANVKSVKKSTPSGLGMGDVYEFDWTAALGDEPVTLEELQAMADMKASLVRFRGQWVEVNAQDIEKALGMMELSGQEATVKDLVKISLGVGGVAGLDVSAVIAGGELGELIGRLKGDVALRDLPVPQDFNATLRPYQLRGYSWLDFMTRAGLGACLADDMGLGKTIQTLALMQRNWESGDREPVLLVCPTSVVNNWTKEAAKFAPHLPTLVHHGLGRDKGTEFARTAKCAAVVITSYALLHRDLATLKPVKWGGVVLDEAQNIKNPEALVSKAAFSLKAGYRIALTGTPVENHVGELRSIMEFLNHGFLGTPAQFKKRFFVPIQLQGDEVAMEKLRAITTPFLLRRLKTDKSIISDLPDKLESAVYCGLTKEQASLYMAIVTDAEETLEALDAQEATPSPGSKSGIDRKGQIFAVLTKLKQVCNHPAHLMKDGSVLPGRSGKLQRLEEMLEEVLAVGERCLIFTQFAEMGELLKAHLQERFGREVLFLHGGVPMHKRDIMVERFQATDADGAPGGGPPIFILSLKAGGTGLNLTNASHVFHYDRWWNPAVENQATDRAYRIGQTRQVQVHKLVCSGTLEERIHDLLERKQALAERVVGTGEGWLTELSTSELKALISLDTESIAD